MKILFLLTCMFSSLYASNFTFTPNGETTKIDETIGALEFHATIKNNGNEKLQLLISISTMVSEFTPVVCVGEKCYPPTVEEIPTQIDAGDSIKIKININCPSNTTGDVTVKAVDYSDSTKVLSLDYTGVFTSGSTEVFEKDVVLSTMNLNVYPNPFNPSTTVNFSIVKEEKVSLKIYNTKGSVVKSLYSGNTAEGSYSHTFDGSMLPSGVYFARLTSANMTVVKKIILLK